MCSHPEPPAEPEEYAKEPCDTDDNVEAQPNGELRIACHWCSVLLFYKSPIFDYVHADEQECMDEEEGDDAEYLPDALPDAGECLTSFCWLVLLGFRNCRCFDPDCYV